MLVAMSTGGVYRTEDGGASWTPSNSGIRVDFVPEEGRFPEYGQCVHKVTRDPNDPEKLFLQNHGGIYRSDDGGRQWQDVSKGVPSDFGFPVVAHPRRSDTAFVIPLEGMGRWTPDGKCGVYRTTDGGQSWEGMTNGLPQEGAYVTVLRDAFCTDKDTERPGFYFGTRDGQIYGSFDDGETWRVLADHLPPVLCVRAQALGD
jgi:photosystem II stability/assembly factor-like uncharacterized protein